MAAFAEVLVLRVQTSVHAEVSVAVSDVVSSPLHVDLTEADGFDGCSQVQPMRIKFRFRIRSELPILHSASVRGENFASKPQPLCAREAFVVACMPVCQSVRPHEWLARTAYLFVTSEQACLTECVVQNCLRHLTR